MSTERTISSPLSWKLQNNDDDNDKDDYDNDYYDDDDANDDDDDKDVDEYFILTNNTLIP